MTWEDVGKPRCKVSSRKAASHPAVLIPVAISWLLQPHETLWWGAGLVRAAADHCHIPFIPLFSALILCFFLQKSPSHPSRSLPFSELFLLYPFGDGADRAKHGDFGIQRQSVSTSGADGITILALLSLTASLIQPNASQDF